MKNVLTALMLAQGVLTFAQTPLKEKKTIIASETELVYQTDENRTKDGSYYVSNTKNNNVWLKGNYANDKRIGNWYFFDGQNNVMFRYNFDNKKLLYLNPLFYKNAKIVIDSKNEDVKLNATVPIPLFPMDLLLNLASENSEVIYALGKVSDADRLNFVSTINTNGTAKYSLEDVNGKSVLKDIDLKIKDFPLDWLPANFNNENLNSKILIAILINKKEEASGPRRNRWNF
jgi:DNA-binding beta-propeller fold protein YncE